MSAECVQCGLVERVAHFSKNISSESIRVCSTAASLSSPSGDALISDTCANAMQGKAAHMQARSGSMCACESQDMSDAALFCEARLQVRASAGLSNATCVSFSRGHAATRDQHADIRQ